MATADDDNSSFKVERLTAENYFSWKFNMKMFLIGKKLWEMVTAAESLPGTASQEEQKRFKMRDNPAPASVCLSVFTSVQIYVGTVQSAKEAWEILQKHFEEKSLSRKIFYWRKLFSARMAKEPT